MRITLGPGETLLETNPPGPPPGSRLSNHTDRSRTTAHGWGAAAFGTLFAGIGAAITTLAVLGTIRPSGGTPLWVVLAFGLVFALAGGSLIVHGVAGVIQRSRALRRREANPREPWTWDHPWNVFGSRDDSGRVIGRLLGFATFTALLLAPFNWVSYFSGSGPLLFKLATAVFDVIIIGTVVRAAYLIARRRKYGVGMLRFRRFPFMTGGEVEVMLARHGPLAQLPSLDATLRCVQERYETTRRGGKRESRVVCYEVWSGTTRSEAGDGRRSTERDFTWRFLLPESVPGTALSEWPPRYWELEVKAEMPGVDYRATFLVPVYADPRAARAVRLAG